MTLGSICQKRLSGRRRSAKSAR